MNLISPSRISKTVFLLLTASTFSACYLEVRDSDTPETKKNKEKQSTFQLQRLAEQCKNDESQEQRSPQDKNQQCYQKLDTVWRPSCRTNECQEVPVYVNYVLNEDLGAQSTVVVEAFDNPHFVGAPASVVQVGHFNTSRPGTYERTSIWLEPGAFYLRAFVTDDDSKIVPYQYQQLQLVSERPLGVFGALSGPSMLTVKPRRIAPNPDPVHIVIDKIFRDPNAKVETNAHLRLSFSAPICSDKPTSDGTTNAAPDAATPVNCTPVPESRTLIVRLFEDDDFLRVPVAAFSMPSEAFLVSTRPGRAELLSPALPTGKYVVLAFVDENANLFYDPGELAQMYTKFAAPAVVNIEANRTAELTMNLTRSPLPMTH